MLLTNHTITGALVGLGIPEPAVAAPVAFASHLALDSLPHFGHAIINFEHVEGQILGVVDVAMSLTAFFIILGLFPDHWGMITLGVFFATLPDLLYIPEQLFKVRLAKGFYKFHHAIQRGTETLPGYIVEASWAIIVIFMIAKML